MLQTVQGGKGSFGRDVMLQTVQGCNVSVGGDVMLQTVQGGRGRWGVTCCYRHCKGKGVGRGKRDVTDSERGKGSVCRDVMLPTVKGKKGAVL